MSPKNVILILSLTIISCSCRIRLVPECDNHCPDANGCCQSHGYDRVESCDMSNGHRPLAICEVAGDGPRKIDLIVDQRDLRIKELESQLKTCTDDHRKYVESIQATKKVIENLLARNQSV